MFETTWDKLDARWGLAPRATGSRPVFILAAGWRSGSTLLQRLVCSSGEVWIWGEPYGRASFIPSLTRSAMCLREEWPTEDYLPTDEVFADPTRHWIANTYPEPGALKDALGKMLDTWLVEPARARGFERFGLKEVRLHAMDAHFLKWLYPDARFLFLVRNPWDAWSSAKGGKWYQQWPTQKITEALGFARHWKRMVDSFMAWPTDDGMLVRYEDLVHPGFDLGQIVEHCGLSHVDASVRDEVIRGMGRAPMPLTALENDQIGRVIGDWASTFGYAPAAAPEVVAAI